MRPCPPIALTMAGSDSGGGAGIQADLHTFAAFEVHALSVVTAVTAQNTRGVLAIEPLPLASIRAQLDAVFDDFRIAAVKIGMLCTPAIVRAAAACLARYPRVPVVLDPVLMATTGATLARSGLVAALRRHLLTRADLLTPNLPEAERLLDRRIGDPAAMLEAARDLRALGARAVLLKGGHLPGGRLHDLLLEADGAHWFRHTRQPVEGHGTGCTLASAIAAGLARGERLTTAVAAGIHFVQRGLVQGYRPGRGRIVMLDRRRPRG